ncbi:ATP-dependent RNA helicase, partial [Aerococcus urinae]|nr:ATP-dependent RNA helicase [Aerococcus urinae]
STDQLALAVLSSLTKDPNEVEVRITPERTQRKKSGGRKHRGSKRGHNKSRNKSYDKKGKKSKQGGKDRQNGKKRGSRHKA